MKVGLLGAGRIGALHASVLARDPAVEEILVGDTDLQRAEKVAEGIGGEAGRIEAVLRAAPDAVVIAASTPAHAPLIRAAVEAGIPAFCEKPIALGYEETVEITREVEASGATLQVASRDASTRDMPKPEAL
jgi:myo-inositol 2-dehydrogenase / D-chiro-inositol 1-dehydrogenase